MGEDYINDIFSSYPPSKLPDQEENDEETEDIMIIFSGENGNCVFVGI